MKRKVLAATLLVAIGLGLTACAKPLDKPTNNDGSNETINNKLQIFNTGLSLTQEQTMSQIKADYLLENKGYKDNDEVVLIVSLGNDALIDAYNGTYYSKYTNVGEFALSKDGLKMSNSIKNAQTALINELKLDGLVDEVLFQYDTVINAISIKTKYKNIEKIGAKATVSKTTLAETYNKPQAIDSNASLVENIVDVYQTGIFNSSSVDYTGNGTAVAILDSGFDCSHSVFAQIPERTLISQSTVAEKLPQSKASEFSHGLELFDVYYSPKIPFVYDYADKDADVFPYDSEHGTHVAGIIGGHDETITGVAVNTQLVLLKVFPDLDSGAGTEAILAALEDAVLFGVDAINLSLGSSCGFAREEDDSEVNRVYDKINESGISLITAASNSYSSGFGGEQGNTNCATNPDSGTVGSPSTYDGSLSVASISGVKSRYIIANNETLFFFKESNSVTGKANDFIKELGIGDGETKTYEYVTIPGNGLKVNYSTVGDLTGKIALIKRGTNTFEEKAMLAKNAGAVACIIYNNVEGDISMSMGKTDHIPTISISKENGTILASKDKGTLTISGDFKAGPFMSDFSSWGVTPSLGIKPEITAHGGEILSAIPGGDYDRLSGTSMASPNLCGIVVLIRQYLKEKYPTYSAKEVSVLANELLMSTATIVLNEYGNPYSPRKQGAGLASLYNAVNTNAYITVDGIDRSKLELGDDKDKTGVYTMEFSVNNLSNSTLNYNLDLVGMTESVSTSDSKYVAEKSYILGGNAKYEVVTGGAINNNTLTVEPNKQAKVKVTYTLTDEDKDYLNKTFANGMYVEGFVKLSATNEEEIDLSIPFLAFYGDWTKAPLFDKTYYEVQAEAKDQSINEEDKLKADYYATTPYGSYFNNYIIPFGTYLYDVDTNKYDDIPASLDHIALSNSLGTIDGISTIYAGLLRNAKTMNYTITDKLTGEVIFSKEVENARKAHSDTGIPIPSFENLKLKSTDLGLINNREYSFKMEGLLDYGDGGLNTNLRNTFNFDFYMDTEAPVLKEVTYEKVYDKTLKKDRYYINMVVYDNHYTQSITPIIFTSSSSYTFLSKNPIPVYSEKGSDTKVRFEITDYLDTIYADTLITSALAFSIDDYALNSNIYICQLPGTKGDFKFTKDGTMDGSDLFILSMYEDEVVDLNKYLASADKTLDEDKDYLKYLTWTSSDEDIVTVKNGQVCAKTPGKVTITVTEKMDLKKAILILNIKSRDTEDNKETRNVRKASNTKDDTLSQDDKIESLDFKYFDTLFAYSRAAQTSEIGQTGSRMFLSSVPNLTFYPGEKIKLSYDFKPWYVEDKYKLTYESTRPDVATVDQDGVVTGLKEGSTNIMLKVEGSNIMARVKVIIKNPFVIENRTLIAYKGLGGDVVIPNDEGILYIGAYAFCLYSTDYSIELTEDDYDANKIPAANTTIKSVVIPDGVEEIQKFAFYNCTGLENITIPNSVKTIREFAFYNDESLKAIDLTNIQVIGKQAFYGCKNLAEINLNKIYALGVSAFEGCSLISEVDLTTLRNTGERAFKDCTNLASVTLGEKTKLAAAMFVNTGVKNIDIYEGVQIPSFIFAKCTKLETVTLHNALAYVGEGAFSDCTSLTTFNINSNVEEFGAQVFYNDSSLVTFTMPNCAVKLGKFCFYKATNLTTLNLGSNTKIASMAGTCFGDTKLNTFNVDASNEYYTVKSNMLVTKDGKEIVLGDYSVTNLVIDNTIDIIGDSAFSGSLLETVTFQNSNVVVGDYAFAYSPNLTSVDFGSGTKRLGNHAFSNCEELATLTNLDKCNEIGEYCFAEDNVKEVVLGDNTTCGEGVFFKSKIEKITIGKNTTFGLGGFQNCLNLKTVVMPEEGNVHFGIACFAYCSNLSTIDLSKLDSIIERETFYGCRSIKAANLLNTVEVGNYAFADCASLNFLAIPKVEVIGEGAFSRYSQYGGAPQISSVELPNTLRKMGDGAFLGCEGLSEITIPESVSSISDYTFAYCKNLRTVNLPSSITKIGKYNFAGCEVLTKINLENITYISDYAFTSCPSLQTVDISNVVEIGFGAFASTSLTGDYELNNLTKLGNYAFQGNDLTSFVALNLERIGEGSFQNNKHLTTFAFNAKLNEVGLTAFNGCESLETFKFNDETTVKINDTFFLNDGILYRVLKTGNYALVSVPQAYANTKLEVIENTTMIEFMAGNNNKNVTDIVLPDSLKSIGGYAFFGYESLKTVEFRSVKAPELEDSYNKNAKLTETDPGYAKLHQYLDLFGLELYYYNFIDLVGKKNPIIMILPTNSDVEGYDSLVYEVYFGTMDEAEHSNYEAKSKALINFVDYATQIKNLNNISLSNEVLINNAVSALNSVKQNPLDYGYSENEWNSLKETVLDAKSTLQKIKLANASDKLQNLQKELDALPQFDIKNLDIYNKVAVELNALKFEEKNLLDLTHYNEIFDAYTEYKDNLNMEASAITNATNTFTLVKTVVLSMSAVCVLGALLNKRTK